MKNNKATEWTSKKVIKQNPRTSKRSKNAPAAKSSPNVLQVHPWEEMTPDLDPSVLQQLRTLGSC